MRQITIVKYQIATYSGEIQVYSDENDTDEEIKATARHQLSKSSPGGLPLGYQNFEIVSRKNRN